MEPIIILFFLESVQMQDICRYLLVFFICFAKIIYFIFTVLNNNKKLTLHFSQYEKRLFFNIFVMLLFVALKNAVMAILIV